MNTELVYGIFKRYVSDGSGSELPEKFEDLPERDRQNIEGLYKEFILAWVDNEFKAALKDEERVQDAARMLVLAFKSKQDTAIESLRMCICTFVLCASDHPCVEEGRKMAAEIRKTFEELLKRG
jgi:hypothetical protein